MTTEDNIIVPTGYKLVMRKSLNVGDSYWSSCDHCGEDGWELSVLATTLKLGNKPVYVRNTKLATDGWYRPQRRFDNDSYGMVLVKDFKIVFEMRLHVIEGTAPPFIGTAWRQFHDQFPEIPMVNIDTMEVVVK